MAQCNVTADFNKSILTEKQWPNSTMKTQVLRNFELAIKCRSPQTSLQRIMKDLRLRLWRPRFVHALNEDDFDRRSQFCEWYVHITEEDPSVEDRILWSDEATFHLKGQVNRHNSVYYAEANPHPLMEGKEFNILVSVSGQLFFWRYSQRWDIPYDAAWISTTSATERGP